MIIDFHTHAFPDSLAEKAIIALEAGCNCKAFHNGKVSSLLKSMDEAGIDKAVICSIATKPAQFEPILEWSKNIVSDRIIPLLSVHPDDERALEKIKIVHEEGFKGIKLHPYYQKFVLDEERMFKFYEEVAKYDLLLVSHTGFDIAFPKDRIADPVRIVNVYKKIPELKLISTHLGSWEDWQEVEKHILGKNIYVETSFAFELIDKETALRILNNHPADYLIFGTDSPWTDQKKELSMLRSLNLDKTLEDKILYKNALTLLGL